MTFSSTILLCFETEINASYSIILRSQNLLYLYHVPFHCPFVRKHARFQVIFVVCSLLHEKLWQKAKFGATFDVIYELEICEFGEVTSCMMCGGRSLPFARTSQSDWIWALRIDGILIQNAGRIAKDWIKERHSSTRSVFQNTPINNSISKKNCADHIVHNSFAVLNHCL